MYGPARVVDPLMSRTIHEVPDTHRMVSSTCVCERVLDVMQGECRGRMPWVHVRKIRTRMHDCGLSMAAPEDVVVLDVVGVGGVCWEYHMCGSGPMRAHAGLAHHEDVYMRHCEPRRREFTARVEG